VNVKVVDLVRDGILLPPKAGVCQTCAVDHDPSLPHNRDSLYFQYAFYKEHGRWPTWLDAMAHCTPEMRSQWTKLLGERGVRVDGNPERTATRVATRTKKARGKR
jgi:hypothetical protein